MKAYTDLEQSKKLAEILSLESADMEYMFLKEDGTKVTNIPFVKDDEEPEWPSDSAYDFIPCWSLAALINVIPYTIYKSDNEFYRLGIDKGYDDYAVWYNNNGFTVTDLDVTSDNFVDACYEMIIKLNELKML